MSNAVICPLQPETPIFREAPHNLEAEQALLGGILVNDGVDGETNRHHLAGIAALLAQQESIAPQWYVPLGAST